MARCQIVKILMDWRKLRGFLAELFLKVSLGKIVEKFIDYVVVGIFIFVVGYFSLAVKEFREFFSARPENSEGFGAKVLLFLQTLANDPLGVITDNFGWFISVALVGSLFAVLIILLLQSRWRLKDQAILVSLAKKAGLGGHWPHAKLNLADGAPWNDLRAEVALTTNKRLYILGASGADTFGRSASPLYEAVSKFGGTLKVILADPDSENTVGRAESVGMTSGAYRREIKLSEKRLRELRSQHHAIEGRFYDGQPNWKMILTERTAWIQYYLPNGLHVAETPVWRFDATENPAGLYHLFHFEFERIWRRCQNKPMDLR